MGEVPQTVGDPIPANCVLIEVHVAELKQLFNSMDASPFRKRDLDPEAEEFIVGWAREAPRDANLGLLVELDRGAGLSDEPDILREAVREYFAYRSQVTRRRLRQLLRVGRTSLFIGVAFLVVVVGLGDFISTAMKGQRIGELLREGLLIGGWVAMWRPIEIFLYGWWPIRAEARLYDRLSAMPVRIAYKGVAAPEAWRSGWPAMPVETAAGKAAERVRPLTTGEDRPG